MLHIPAHCSQAVRCAQFGQSPFAGREVQPAIRVDELPAGSHQQRAKLKLPTAESMRKNAVFLLEAVFYFEVDLQS
jgi:hypothetical protein